MVQGKTIPPAQTESEGAHESLRSLDALNADLEKHALPTRLTETYLVSRLEWLQSIPVTRNDLAALTWARLTELTLRCAGHYADHGELSAAGDLLVNPRRIHLHVRGRQGPMIKKRHTPISGHFDRGSRNRKQTIAWLKKNCTAQVVLPPLLVDLEKRLKAIHILSADYLESVSLRMRRITEVMGAISAWGIFNSDMLYERLCKASQKDRAFLNGSLCGFDCRIFDALGREMERIRFLPESRTRFLKFFREPVDPRQRRMS
jgi:hypothetical protein